MCYKECFKCFQTKILDDFYKHNQMADGYLGKCKACAKEDVKKHREQNLSSIKAYDRKRGASVKRKEAVKRYAKTDRGSERLNQARRARLQRNPEKRAAHIQVQAAKRLKKLTELPCEVCGLKAHAHHDDYSKPLNVRWLCSKHHSAHHKELRSHG